MLLATKLFVPVLPYPRVPRPRLHARLGAALATRLALVSAPPGFGKSTLVAEWLAGLAAAGIDLAYCWFSLDEQDNDPSRFYTHLLAALHAADPAIGGDLPALLHSPELPSGETLMSTIINDAADQGRALILVLDDYHAIENPDLHKAMIFLIDNLPASMHLVISSRANPPFPLARWRVRRTLLELREKDLRFRHDEIGDFLQEATGIRLDEAQIAAVEQRTEGWIGALQLASLSLQGTGDLPAFLDRLTGSHAYIVDYLVEEVLNRQTETVQRFLLQTATLDRMCGDLCAAVTGIQESEAILHSLHQQNLFIVALDEERYWFRYHHLFGDMLRARMRRVKPGSGAGLCLAASAWCEANGWLGEAVHYALAAPDHLRAAQLIERHYWALLERSEFSRLRSWLQQLPPDLIRTRPRLSLASAWSLYATYRSRDIAASLDDAERSLARVDVEAGDEHGAEQECGPHAEVLTLRASNAMYAGETEQAIDLAQHALRADTHDRALIYCANTIALAYSWIAKGDARCGYEWAFKGCERGTQARLPFLAAENQEIVLLYLERAGAWEEGDAIIQRVLAAAAGGDGFARSLATSAHLFYGRSLFERYELEKAAEHLLAAQQNAARLGIDYVLIKCHIHLMLVRQAQGRWLEAQRHIQEMWALSQGFSGYYLQWHAALAAYACLLEGDTGQAATFMRYVGVRPSDEVTAHNEPDAWVLARYLYAQGRFDAALNLADRLRALHAALQRPKREMEMWCLRALVLWQWHSWQEALAALDQALAIGQRFRFLHGLITMPQLLQELLTAYAARYKAASHVDFARELLALAANRPEPSSTPALIEALSERELQVLQLVAEGLSDRQIAEQLIVVPGTVKRHLNNIYGKLGVHSRTQALARARNMGMIV